MNTLAPAPSILVVEDESLIRMMAVDMLEQAGFHVLECDSCESALSVIDDHRISGLLTDVELGGPMDGIALAHVVHDSYPQTAIVVVSGQVKGDLATLPDNARLFDKPYDTAVVIDLLNELIAK